MLGRRYYIVAVWLRSALRKAGSSSGYAAMGLFTLPYYRTFRQNTLLPILAIVNSANLRKDESEIAAMLSRWRDRKMQELYFVQVAATLLSAAAIGCLSWDTPECEHWIGPAAWYCSLVLSLFSVLLSTSESFIFTTIIQKESQAGSKLQPPVFEHDLLIICRIIKNKDSLRSTNTSSRARSGFFISESEDVIDNDLENGERQQGLEAEASDFSTIDTINDDVEIRVRWNMVFTWQAPMMLLAYSVVAFLVGLTVYVCAPLYGECSYQSKTAISFLATLVLGSICFIWCSFWAYRFVDMEEP
ncbi:uncharacterized protein F4817DRAFT_365356 [Daldinia loculata]|uniref:uncharacterized protein n=1 Tax=Daldinia loculata TaxID=103429 RepID=UPI0020C3F0CE|nr:uncharacterized protein F4817DRAFT_365356 [Daldinia loculata]KAI1647212.1 hypothetical protein F4817DRAFT_365356 [Daldinia loculata]